MVAENRTRSVLVPRMIAFVCAVIFAFVLTISAKAIGITALELFSAFFVPVLLGQTALDAWRRRRG